MNAEFEKIDTNTLCCKDDGSSDWLLLPNNVSCCWSCSLDRALLIHHPSTGKINLHDAGMDDEVAQGKIERPHLAFHTLLMWFISKTTCQAPLTSIRL